MPQIDIGECLSYGVDRFKSNLSFHLLALLVVLVVTLCSLGLLSGALTVGYIRAIRKQEQGGSMEIGDLFSAFDTFVPTFILLLVMIVASLVPFGSFVFAPVYFVGLYLIALGEQDGVAALKRAFALCQPVFVMSVVAAFVFSIVSGLGLLLCCVGIFVTGPVALLANIRMAERIVDGSQSLQQPSF